MGTVNIDVSELRRFGDRIQNVDIDLFCRKVAKEVASRLLRKVVKKTPVGVYKDKVGGNLRRGWSIDETVTKEGTVYKISVFNPVEYASYVEYGHRTANHRGWVEGQFFLTISEREIQSLAPNLVKKRIEEELRRQLNV